MKSKHFELEIFSYDDIIKLTSVREGENKLGQKIKCGFVSDAKFVLIGVQEDVGPQANLGNKGAQNAFSVALSRFVNMQANRFCMGENIACLGYVRQLTDFSTVEKGRELVEKLDDFLVDLLVPIYNNGQIPIIVGGGHNNAYPLIKAYFLSKGEQLEVINCDPHADCRRLEGRHSGNPFSYARQDGFLYHYNVLGLHKAYNSEAMLNYLDENQFNYTFFEDYLDNSSQLLNDLNEILKKGTHTLGVELDLDAIKRMPSSAFTPSGFELEEVRRYLRKIVQSDREIAYLHLPEGAPQNEYENKIVGKAIAYLLHDFVSGEK